MRAAILAAGVGSRLQEYTLKIPKCLVTIRGKPILRYQLDAIVEAGITEIIVVAGYRSDQVMRYVNGETKVVLNAEYESTNSIYSLWLAREFLEGREFVVLNGDVIVPRGLMVSFLNYHRRTAALVDASKELSDDEMNIAIEDDSIVGFSKAILAKDADAESVQIVKFGPHDSTLLFDRIEELICMGNRDLYPADAYDVLLRRSRMYPYYCGGSAWFEIDTVKDLLAAEEYLSSHQLQWDSFGEP